MTNTAKLLPNLRFPIQREWFADIMGELTPLFDAHWQESAEFNNGRKRDTDWDKYLMLESVGSLHCVTVRHEGQLIGYFFNFITPNLHDRTLLVSISDMIYVMPEFRGGTRIAENLIETTEALLRLEGVKKIHIVLPVGGISAYFRRKGFKHIEDGHSKWIGD